MRLGQATVVAFSILAPAVLLGQATQGLSITNYQAVSTSSTPFRQNVTYTADLMNTGGPLGSVTATLTSLNLVSFSVAPGRDTLHFGFVPGHSQVTTADTVLLLVNPAVPFSFNDLHWDFQTTSLPPVANAGPNQAAKLGSTVFLNGSGSTNPSGSGMLTYSWVFTSRPGGSKAQLTNPTSVTPSFVLDVPGNYTVALTVSNGGASSTATVAISTIYTPPLANAGPNQTAPVGSTVTLDGSGSIDLNGQPLTYFWALLSRPATSITTLSGSNTVSPTFVVDKPGTYVAQLVVNDTQNNSPPATVTITTLNSPPVANAGHNMLITAPQLVQLDGSGSTDVDGDALTYKWSLLSVPDGSAAVLSDPTAVNPTFTADLAGIYVAQLIVNDGTFNSKPATVMFTTHKVLPPTAQPGANQTIVHGSYVQLNGSGTDPQNFPLTYQWTLLSAPMGSKAALSNISVSSPTFFADLPGTYIAQLIVSDLYLSSRAATVTITTTETPPVANAGQNRTATLGATVTLDGSGSFDADHDPITYSWSLLKRPDGSSATLFAANTVSPMFVADVPGVYVAQLIASDPFSSSNPATVTITAVQTVKLSLTPNPLNMSTGGPSILNIGLAGPAGPGGQVVNLTSFNTSVATVPATVMIPEGSASFPVMVTPGGTGGTTAILATASGVQQTFAIVNVVAASIRVTTDGTAMGPTRTTNGTVTLSSPAPAGGTVVTLSATPGGILDIQPPTVAIAAGALTGAFTVTGLDIGDATITASAPGFNSGSEAISIVLVGYIILPANLNVPLGQSVPFPVRLATPAPVGGVTINLASDNQAVTVTPSQVFIAGGRTTPVSQPVITGTDLKTAHISASAPGFLVSTPTALHVTAALGFSPVSVSFAANSTANVTLTLSGFAPAGLTVTLSSDDPTVATVSSPVIFTATTNQVNVTINGAGPGTTQIHAAAPGVTGATIGVTVN